MWLKATGKTRAVKRACLLVFALIILGSSILPSFELVTVDSSLNNNTGAQVETQRHILYDGTRWWIFYYNGTSTLYRYSSDLTTWSSPTVLWKGWYQSANFLRSGTDVKIYGTTVYAVTDYYDAPFWRIYFRNGTISGTSITWSAPVLVVADVAFYLGAPTVSKASTGRIWFSYATDNGDELTAYFSDNGGVTWTSNNFGANTAGNMNFGTVMSPMASGRMMLIGSSTTTHRPRYTIYGAGWSALADVATGALSQTYTGGFSIVADPYNADIQYFTYLDTTGGNNIRFIKYNSGWGSVENVSLSVDASSFPVISYDGTSNKTTVAWVQSNSIYIRNRTSTGTWGTVTKIGDMGALTVSYPPDLIGSIQEWNSRLAYAVVTGVGVPFNLTLVGYYVGSTTTTTTGTVTTLTTQTTTADTIVDAVANQFEAVMENLFPALIIILVFVYLAYKAGASGEVLAYVFIITLVLTSFINLMPWWITVIVSVIMISILLNYRQRGGGANPA